MAPSHHLPPEWAPHARCWLAYPSRADLWQETLVSAQAEFAAFCRLLAEHEPVAVLVPDAAAGAALAEAVDRPGLTWHVEPYGDIWLRDTGPLFLLPGPPAGAAGAAGVAADGPPHAACFRFNGWGERYLYPADTDLAARLAARAGWAPRAFPIVLEGGSVDVDGTGLVLTSRQCLLNPNRNRGLGAAAIEAQVAAALGGAQVLWLGDGLVGDHTDGHIDNIARFIGPRHIVYMRASGADDPHRAVLEAIEADLHDLAPADGPPLRLSPIPSPGAVAGDDGGPLPASYLNFLLANGVAIMPTFGSVFDAAALAALAPLLPGRRLVGLSARAILGNGGGAFHCMSQQEPIVPAALVGRRRAAA